MTFTSPELLAQLSTQLDTLDMLRAMYPLPSELQVLQPSESQLSLLRIFIDSNGPIPTSLPSSLRLIIRIDIFSPAPQPESQLQQQQHPTNGEPFTVELEVSLPFVIDGKPTLYLRQPSWMSKSAYAEMIELLPASDRQLEEGEGSVVEDVLVLAEALREEGERFTPTRDVEPAPTTEEEFDPDEMGMDRVWFWLYVDGSFGPLYRMRIRCISWCTPAT